MLKDDDILDHDNDCLCDNLDGLHDATGPVLEELEILASLCMVAIEGANTFVDWANPGKQH